MPFPRLRVSCHFRSLLICQINPLLPVTSSASSLVYCNKASCSPHASSCSSNLPSTQQPRSSEKYDHVTFCLKLSSSFPVLVGGRCQLGSLPPLFPWSQPHRQGHLPPHGFCTRSRLCLKGCPLFTPPHPASLHILWISPQTSSPRGSLGPCLPFEVLIGWRSFTVDHECLSYLHIHSLD